MTAIPFCTTYLVFTADHPRADAIAVFVARYGCTPAEVIEYNRQLWVGPVVTKC